MKFSTLKLLISQVCTENSNTKQRFFAVDDWYFETEAVQYWLCCVWCFCWFSLLQHFLLSNRHICSSILMPWFICKEDKWLFELGQPYTPQDPHQYFLWPVQIAPDVQYYIVPWVPQFDGAIFDIIGWVFHFRGKSNFQTILEDF